MEGNGTGTGQRNMSATVRKERQERTISMNHVLRVLFMLLIGACSVGCGKESALEGKVIDGKGQPLAGVKVRADKAQPTKGYEKFEATDGRDGAFRFPKLFPDSEYQLVAYYGKNSQSNPVEVMSAPQGATRMLPVPIEIRFMVSEDGATVRDTRTDLMWTRDATMSKELNYQEAVTWVQGLDIGGYRDWRLPSIEELKEVARYDGLNPLEYLNKGGFQNVLPGLYWSVSLAYDGNNPNYNWCASMKERDPNLGDIRTQGSVGCGNNVQQGYAIEKHHVWPVRDGR
jgi:hypothetical protein